MASCRITGRRLRTCAGGVFAAGARRPRRAAHVPGRARRRIAISMMFGAPRACRSRPVHRWGGLRRWSRRAPRSCKVAGAKGSCCRRRRWSRAIPPPLRGGGGGRGALRAGRPRGGCRAATSVAGGRKRRMSLAHRSVAGCRRARSSRLAAPRSSRTRRGPRRAARICAPAPRWAGPRRSGTVYDPGGASRIWATASMNEAPPGPGRTAVLAIPARPVVVASDLAECGPRSGGRARLPKGAAPVCWKRQRGPRQSSSSDVAQHQARGARVAPHRRRSFREADPTV